VVVSAAAAIAASSAHPTGVAAWDALSRAAFAAGVTWLAARSRPRWWIAGSAIIAIGSVNHAIDLAAALATLGAAAALAASARRSPVAGALIGAVVAQLALRMTWPHQRGATALLAAAAIVPIALSGITRSPREQRRAVRRVSVVVIGLTVIGGLVGLAGLLLSRRAIERGGDQLAIGLEAARRADASSFSQALDNASGDFARARNTLDATWLLPARLVPVVSQHVRALQLASRAGNEISLAGSQALHAAQLDRLRVDHGHIPVDALRELQQPLDVGARDLGRARAILAKASSPWLLPNVAARLDRETSRVVRTTRDVQLASDIVRGVSGLAGADGPRRYFLAIQTPSELRASGGIIGSFGEVNADRGGITIGAFGRDLDLNTRGVPPTERVLKAPPEYIARYARFHPERLWQNVPASPDFPTVAAVISSLYPQSGGTPVDGVISVDPTALAALLRVVGPVTVSMWPEPISADNAENILLNEQYVRFADSARVNFLGSVAQAVAQRITSAALPPVTEIVHALAPSARAHHLLVWSSNAIEQRMLQGVGVDGSFAPKPVAADALAVVNQNASGNKLDWYLRRSTTYEATIDPKTRRLTGTATVTLQNASPSSGLPALVIGESLANVTDPPGTNRTYLSVYSPWRVSKARIDGRPALFESAAEAGRYVYSMFLVIPSGATTRIEFDVSGTLPVSTTDYRLDVRAQALVSPETLSIRVRDGRRDLVVRPAAAVAGDLVLPASR
jgi:hypothetical protein